MDLFLLIEMAILSIAIIIGSILASAVAEALQYRYSDTLIACVIALLQTLPEYVVVVAWSLDGHLDIALASIIGANVLLLAFGISSVIVFAYLAGVKDIRKDKALDLMRENSLESIFLALSGVYMIIIGLKGYLDLIDSIILLFMFVFYTWLTTRLPPEIEFEEPHGLARKFLDRKGLSVIVIVLSILIIGISGELFAEKFINAIELIAVSPLLLAAVISPIITELPEKLIAYMMALKNEDLARLGILNFMSSRINNGTLLFSSMFFATIISGHLSIFEHVMIPRDLTVLLLLAGLISIFGAITTVDRKITVPESIVLMVVYAISMYAIEAPHYAYIVCIVLLILTILVIANAAKYKRFYWVKDLKYTLNLAFKRIECQHSQD